MNKKNLILGGILILLAASAYLYQGPIRKWQSSLDKPDNFLAGLNIDEINRIELENNKETTVLEKIDEKWKIGGTKSFFAEDSAMENMFTVLKDGVSASVELVSENNDKKEEFQTNESGVNVKFFQSDNQLINFIVGKTGNDFSSTYISLPESEKTYLLKLNLNSVLSRASWYDMAIFSSAKENINKIRFQYPTREFTIEKKDDAWSGVLPYVFSVSEEKIEEILDIMSSLSAVEIPEQVFGQTGLEKNLIIIQATGEGVDNILMVGEANDNDYYYVKKGDSDNIYLITEEQRDKLDRQIRDLK
ncbi:hypothetical protein DRH27_00305 [Candidatus Falkowbacteria bacterium]|nr:MAG: hypothetical protein DRH27_00305 [Candidatus Falkowbacteria bacterium]